MPIAKNEKVKERTSPKRGFINILTTTKTIAGRKIKTAPILIPATEIAYAATAATKKIIRIVPKSKFIKYVKNKNLSYDIYVNELKKYNVLYPNNFSNEIKNYGFDCIDIVYGDNGVIEKWFDKNNIFFNKKILFENLLLNFVNYFKPDFIFVYAGAMLSFSKKQAEDILQINADIKFLGMWGDELPKNRSYEDFLFYKHIFTASDAYITLLDKFKIKSTFLGNCYSQSTFFNTESIPETNDVIFCGETGFGYPDHIKRYNFLLKLMEQCDSLKIFASEVSRPYTYKQLFKIKVTEIIAILAPRFLLNTLINGLSKTNNKYIQFLRNILQISKNVKDGDDASSFFINPQYKNGDYFFKKKSLKNLFPNRVFSQPKIYDDYLKLLSSSKIILNIHRDELADVANIRCFEATGLKKCLLTNHNPKISSFFNNSGIMTFKSITDCVNKINFLLDNSKKRIEIANNGYKQTLNNHTVTHRVKKFCETLRSL